MNSSTSDVVSSSSTGDGHPKYYVVAIVGLVSALLSWIGSAFVIMCFCVLKRARNFRSRMIVNLCACDLLSVTCVTISLCSYLASDGHTPNALCDVTGFGHQTGMLASFIWVDNIAIVMFLQAILHLRPLKSWWFRDWLFMVIAYLPAIVVAILPLFDVAEGYGVVVAWCWLNGVQQRIYFAYIPLWLSFLFITVIYAIVARRIYKDTRERAQSIDQGAHRGKATKLSKKSKELTRRYMKKVLRQLSPYPLILFVTCGFSFYFFFPKLISNISIEHFLVIKGVPPTINRVWNWADPGGQGMGMQIVHIIFQESQGFLNSLFYGLEHWKFIVLQLRLIRSKLFQGPKLSQLELDTLNGTDDDDEEMTVEDLKPEVELEDPPVTTTPITTTTTTTPTTNS
ncbi:hypothetical protein Pelo_62 [Pelomyxa schiedti]|nr:hypothetical protein Pelo_62 [Pelomyxa schiedti]